MGLIKEFPGLQIDDFKTYKEPPLLCLLSHAHSDHLLGLDRQSYYGPVVYCTAATRSLVLNLRGNNSASNPLKYNRLRKENCGIEILQTLELNQPKILSCGSIDLKVTAIDAHHCPASCMFLIQSESSAVLYTGDIRCEQWYVNMLATHPSLLAYTVGNKPINIYMDNIYEQHREHSLEYHNSSQGITQLIQLLDRGYPFAAPFCAVFSTIGYENVLIALAEKFNTRIHMDPYYYSLYVSAADTCPHSRALVEISTVDPNVNCRIHWCKKGECSVRARQDAVFFSPCITISEAAVNERNNPLDISDFDIAGNCNLPVFANAETGARYVLATDSHTLLPGHLLFYFSRHASRPCLSQLIDTFTTKTVRSLDGNPMQGFSSFQSSGTSDEIPTDSESQLPIKSLPIIRKQPVRIRERQVAKRKKYSTSSSSSSNDDALMFLQCQVQPARVMEEQQQIAVEATVATNVAAPDAVNTLGSPLSQSSTTAGCAQVVGEPPHSNKNTSTSLKETVTTLGTQETMANESLLSPPPEKRPQGAVVESQAAASPKLEPGDVSAEVLPNNGLNLEVKRYGATQNVVPRLSQHTAASKESINVHDVNLEDQLRQDGDTWFSLKFDWRV